MPVSWVTSVVSEMAMSQLVNVGVAYWCQHGLSCYNFVGASEDGNYSR